MKKLNEDVLRNVKTKMSNGGPFGLTVLPELKRLKDHDDPFMVIMINDGYGRKPIRVSLAHQLTVEGVNEILSEYPNTKEIEVFPLYKELAVTVWKK